MLKEDAIKDSATTLNLVNFQIAELLRIKEELEARLCALLEHGDDGSRTYTCDKFKITVTTGYIYTLDKNEYMTIGNQIPACFNPVKQRISYDIDKQVIRDAEKYASAEEMALLSQVISKKPKKLHLKLGAAV